MEQDQKQIFVFASPEIQELLIDNDTDLAELLIQENVEVKRGFAVDPADSNDSGHKEPVSIIILSSAALVVALTPIVKRVLEDLSGTEVVVDDLIWVPVEDSSGNVVYDAYGQPVLQRARRAEIVESSKYPRDEMESVIKGPFGWEIRYKSSPTK